MTLRGKRGSLHILKRLALIFEVRSFLLLYGLLSLWYFAIVVNYFQVSFKMNVILFEKTPGISLNSELDPV